MERGPADGGSGGNGGSVVIRASESVSDLTMPMQNYTAGSGAHGSGAGQDGRRGADKLILVPCGTTVQRLGHTTMSAIPTMEPADAPRTFMADLPLLCSPKSYFGGEKSTQKFSRPKIILPI